MTTDTTTPFLIPLGNDNYEFRLDNSGKELFESCARAAEYYTVWRREKEGSRASLFRGKVIHHCMALRRNLHLQNILQTKWEAEQMAYILSAYAGIDFGEEEWRTAEHAVNTVLEYNKTWPITAEPFTVVEGSVEKPFKLLLGEAELDADIVCHLGRLHINKVTIYWTGILDARVIYGSELVLDSKTTSILGSNFWDNFVLDSQMLGYVWSAKQLGWPVDGYYVDAICGRKPTKSGKAFEFQRQRFFADQEQVDEWARDTYTLVTDFLEHLCRGYFPKSPKWCFGKYGRCQYWDVCTQPPSHRESILQSDLFKNVTWNPLNPQVK